MRAALLVLLVACDGPPTSYTLPDAAPPDAFVADAALPDAAPPDAAPPDAAPPDAALDAGPGGPGEACGEGEPFCTDDLFCQWLQLDAEAICTRECLVADDCIGFARGVCCGRPGFQVSYTVCVPAAYAASCL